MTKKYYRYNADTDSFSEVKQYPHKKLIKFLSLCLATFLTAFILYLLFSYYLPSPREMMMSNDIARLEKQYDQLYDRFTDLDMVLENLRQRDGEVYELVLGTQPIDDHVWHGGVGGHDLTGDRVNDNLGVAQLNSTLNEIERKLVLQSKYLDEIESLATERDMRQRHIPSIRPVHMDHQDKYIQLLSGFGMRMHPVHKMNKMHKGLDFPQPVGTPVLATGNGKVVKVSKRKTGYGTHVVIDHGFGFESLYAHLSKVDVRVGQEVVRGEQIGEVGSTGTVTAPHLHYEVHKNGHAVNPVHYCMDGLTPEEYDALTTAANKHNYSFD